MVERFEYAVDGALTERVDVTSIAENVAMLSDRVRLELPADVPAANLNPIVARRVLEELVSNAIRFSDHDSPVIVRLSRGPGGAEVRVIDRGSGIREVERERIFAPLEQGEELNARMHQGIGMGLSLARTAARAADGDIVIERTGAGGSTFLWRVGPEA